MAEEVALAEYLKAYGEGRAQLAGSRAKLDRAQEHLKSLKVEMRRFREKDSHAGSGHTHSDTGVYALFVAPKKVPERLSAIVGDVICNLRPALDYLVFALARLDAGETQEGTQFPICDSPQQFKRRGRVWLKGLSTDHVTAIERLQPYDTRKEHVWLRWLRDLSNPDKHQELSVIASDIGGDFEIVEKPRRTVKRKRAKGVTTIDLTPANLAALSERINKRTEPKAKKGLRFSIPADHELAGADVYVYLGLRFDVTLQNGLPVVETLELLHSQTRKLVKAFEPEFKG